MAGGKFIMALSSGTKGHFHVVGSRTPPIGRQPRSDACFLKVVIGLSPSKRGRTIDEGPGRKISG